MIQLELKNYAGVPRAEVDEEHRGQGNGRYKDEGVKQHHSVSRQGGLPQSWVGQLPMSETASHTAGYLPSLTSPTNCW